MAGGVVDNSREGHRGRGDDGGGGKSMRREAVTGERDRRNSKATVDVAKRVTRAAATAEIFAIFNKWRVWETPLAMTRVAVEAVAGASAAAVTPGASVCRAGDVLGASTCRARGAADELAVRGEVVAEFGKGAVVAFFGGFLGVVGEAGDFGQGQVGGVAEEQDVALGGGEGEYARGSRRASASEREGCVSGEREACMAASLTVPCFWRRWVVPCTLARRRSG